MWPTTLVIALNILIIQSNGFIAKHSQRTSTHFVPGKKTQRPSRIKTVSSQLNEKKIASFGMGCFWAPQKRFDEVNGVTKTLVGYSGGSNEKPTYKSVCDGDGHVETVLVEFENSVVSYERLLDIFFEQPYDDMKRQYSQYQSVIWTHDNDQLQAINKKFEQLNADNDPRAALPNLKVANAMAFYIAERYHQNYLQTQPVQLAVLTIVAAIGYIPDIDPLAHKAANIALLSYIILTLFDRYILGRIQVKEYSHIK